MNNQDVIIALNALDANKYSKYIHNQINGNFNSTSSFKEIVIKVKDKGYRYEISCNAVVDICESSACNTNSYFVNSVHPIEYECFVKWKGLKEWEYRNIEGIYLDKLSSILKEIYSTIDLNVTLFKY